MQNAGVPGAYPLAINQPLDRAYLRPLQEPLYDTEMYDFNTPPASLTFFQRPISQTTANLSITKTEAETNLNQSSMLDYPREFSILGFNIVFDSTVGLQLLAAVYRRAFFLFTFSGRRPYLQIPLGRIPCGIGLEGAIGVGNLSVTSAASGVYTQFKNGMGHIANYYKFNLGRSALKIKPGEAFNGKIGWPTATPTGTGYSTLNSVQGTTITTPAGLFTQLLLIGLSWSPL
jgi:hypothetical protein